MGSPTLSYPSPRLLLCAVLSWEGGSQDPASHSWEGARFLSSHHETSLATLLGAAGSTHFTGEASGGAEGCLHTVAQLVGPCGSVLSISPFSLTSPCPQLSLGGMKRWWQVRNGPGGIFPGSS